MLLVVLDVFWVRFYVCLEAAKKVLYFSVVCGVFLPVVCFCFEVSLDVVDVVDVVFFS